MMMDWEYDENLKTLHTDNPIKLNSKLIAEEEVCEVTMDCSLSSIQYLKQ